MKNLDLREVGTREKHYNELLELWEDSHELLRQRQLYMRSFSMIAAQADLDVCIEMLKKSMRSLKGFNQDFYEDSVDAIGKIEGPSGK